MTTRPSLRMDGTSAVVVTSRLRCVDAEAAGQVVDSAWRRRRRERSSVKDGDSCSRPDRILTVTPDAAFVMPATVSSRSATLPGSSFLTRRAPHSASRSIQALCANRRGLQAKRSVDSDRFRTLLGYFATSGYRQRIEPAPDFPEKRLKIKHLEETEGFEPSMRLLTTYSLSRGAPSATRSRLPGQS